MKKIIALVCLLVCMVLLCVSCSKKGMTADDYFANYSYEEKRPTFTTSKKLDDLYKLDYVKNLNEIIVFTNNDDTNPKTKFYNAELAQFVLEMPSKKLVASFYRTVYTKTFLFTIEKDEVDTEVTYTLNLYDAKGTKVSGKKISYDEYNFSLDNYIETSSDFLKFNDVIYRVGTDGTATSTITNPFFGSLPSSLTKTSKYYYRVTSGRVTVYDYSLNEVFYWEMPYSTYDNTSMTILSSEKVLVQISDVLPENEKKYDYIDDEGIKYSITSIILDVATGKEKQVDLDYVVVRMVYASNRVYTSDSYDFMNEKIDNLAYVYYIKDHKMLTEDGKYVALAPKNASVKFEVMPELDRIPSAVTNDRYSYTSDSGITYLLNGKGDIVSRVNNLSSLTQNDNYILIDNKIYDYNINLVYDLEANNKELVQLMANGFIVKDTKGDIEDREYHLHTKSGSVVTIENYYTVNTQYYITREYNSEDSTYKYSFYNDNGSKILTLDEVTGTPSVIYTYEDNAAVLVSIKVDGKVTYYKLSK